MRITLLGTGTPILDPKHQASTVLIEIEEDKLLFDAGRGVTTQLAKAGVDPKEIDSVFITHHHYDHIGNLGDFLLTSWHSGREIPQKVFGPPGTSDLIVDLFDKIYVRDISFALFSVDGVTDIRELVQVKEVASKLVYQNDKCKVFAEYVDHGNSLGLSQEDWPCLGYRIEAEGKVVAISGDTVACNGLNSLAKNADVLIQCCYLAEDEITNPSLERLAKHIIACSGQVGKIATQNKVKKLVLTHIRPKSEAMMQSLMKDVRGDYSGDVVLGEDLMVVDV